jgi:hypothetical protein
MAPSGSLPPARQAGSRLRATSVQVSADSVLKQAATPATVRFESALK